jgi:hypothetical protein
MELVSSPHSILECDIQHEDWERQAANLVDMIAHLKTPSAELNDKALKASSDLQNVLKYVRQETDPQRRTKSLVFLSTTARSLVSELADVYLGPSTVIEPKKPMTESMLVSEDSVQAVKTVVQHSMFSTVFDRSQAIMISESNDSYDQLGIDMTVQLSDQAQSVLLDEELAIQIKSNPKAVTNFLDEIKAKHARNDEYISPHQHPLVVCCGQYGHKELAAEIAIQLCANTEIRNPRKSKQILDILHPDLIIIMQNTLARTEMEYEMIQLIKTLYQVSNELGPRRVRKQTKRNTNSPDRRAASLIDQINNATVDRLVFSGSTSRFGLSLQ